LLYTKYRGPLFRYVAGIISSPEVAAELVQETYLKVMRQSQLSRFELAARNYLFETATNLARDHIRRARHRRCEPLLEEAELVPDVLQNQPELLLAWDQTLDALRAGINRLPPLTRDIFVMNRLREMPYSMIATELRIGIRTVERHMAQAIQSLERQVRDAI